jgi:GxxExxY protein
VGTGPRKLDTDWVTGQIIGGAIDVHRYLGPGMLEHTYEVCLEAALRQRGLQVERQVPVRVRCLDVGLLFNVNVDVLAAGGWKQVLRRR